MALRGRGLIPAALTCMALAACGRGEGLGEGATVTVYAGARPCAGAAAALRAGGARKGSVAVRLVCARRADRGGRLDLAAVGAAARRASEDTSAVAYIESPGRALDFSRPILEEAQIPVIVEASGAAGMALVLGKAGSASSAASLRESIEESG
jgi:hypothetical protein